MKRIILPILILTALVFGEAEWKVSQIECNSNFSKAVAVLLMEPPEGGAIDEERLIQVTEVLKYLQMALDTCTPESERGRASYTAYLSMKNSLRDINKRLDVRKLECAKLYIKTTDAFKTLDEAIPEEAGLVVMAEISNHFNEAKRLCPYFTQERENFITLHKALLETFKHPLEDKKYTKTLNALAK